MGRGGVVRGPGHQSHTGYYIALAGILSLLVLLCCYFCYFFIRKVIELSEQMTPCSTPTTSQPKGQSSYPVQPVVRDSATAMAMLCKQVPPVPSKGDTVFPTSTSPAALQTDTGSGVVIPPAPAPDMSNKLVPPAAVTVVSEISTR